MILYCPSSSALLPFFLPPAKMSSPPELLSSPLPMSRQDPGPRPSNTGVPPEGTPRGPGTESSGLPLKDPEGLLDPIMNPAPRKEATRALPALPLPVPRVESSTSLPSGSVNCTPGFDPRRIIPFPETLPPATFQRMKLPLRYPRESETAVWYVTLLVSFTIPNRTGRVWKHSLPLPVRSPGTAEASIEPPVFRIQWLRGSPMPTPLLFQQIVVRILQLCPWNLEHLWLTPGLFAAQTTYAWTPENTAEYTITQPTFVPHDGLKGCAELKENFGVFQQWMFDPEYFHDDSVPDSIDFGLHLDTLLGTIRPWRTQQGDFLASKFWELVLPGTLWEDGYFRWEEYAGSLMDTDSTWEWKEGGPVLTALYRTLATRPKLRGSTSSPVKALPVGPDQILAPVIQFSEYDAGWGGLLGVLRSLHLSVNLGSSGLKAGQAQFGIPWATWQGIWRAEGFYPFPLDIFRRRIAPSQAPGPRPLHLTAAAGRYRGPLGRPVFGKITPDYGYVLNYSFPRICDEKAMPVKPLRTPKCQVYASECYFPFPPGNQPLELYECERYQAVPKPSYGFGWEPSFTQSRNFPLVEAKVRLIHHYQVRHPSVAGEDTPDSRSASSEAHRTPGDNPEENVSTEQGIPDETKKFLHASRPRQTPARPPIVPRRQRIGNWKKEFRSMTKEQIRKTQKLAKYEEQPYDWDPVFTESEEDHSDPAPEMESYLPPRMVLPPAELSTREGPKPVTYNEPTTASRKVSTLPDSELVRPAGIRLVQAQLPAKTANSSRKVPEVEAHPVSSLQSARPTSPAPSLSRISRPTEERTKPEQVRTRYPEPTPTSDEQTDSFRTLSEESLSSRRTSSPEPIPRKSRLLQLPLNYDVTSFRTARHNPRLLQINLNTLLGDLTLDVDSHSLGESSLLALERFARATRKSQRRTSPSPEPCKPVKVLSGKELSRGHQLRTRPAPESPTLRTKLRSPSYAKRSPSRVVRRASRRVDSPKLVTKRSDSLRNRGRRLKKAIRTRDSSPSSSPEPEPIRSRNSRRKSSLETESPSPRTRPRRVTRQKLSSRTKRTPER